MKKAMIFVTIATVVLFLACDSFAADPFAGLQITPPDESVSPDIRALFGKSGKWGKKGGWDGIWHPDISVSRSAGSQAKDEPGVMAIINLTNKKAKLHFTYGESVYDNDAKVFGDDKQGVCMQVEEKITPPGDRNGDPPIFCLKEGKMMAKWQGFYTMRTMQLSPLD